MRTVTASSGTSPLTVNLIAAPGTLGTPPAANSGPTTIVIDWITATARVSANATPNLDIKDAGATRFKTERQNVSGAAATLLFDYTFFGGDGPRLPAATPQIVLTTGSPTQLYVNAGYHYESD